MSQTSPDRPKEVRAPTDPVPTNRPGMTRSPSRAAGWRTLALPAAAIWSAAYLGLGCAWLAGAGGNPADPTVDPGWRFTLLGTWGPHVGAALITGAAAAGVLVAVAMVRSRARLPRLVATMLGLGLTVVVPDYRLIEYLAYTPVLPVLKIAGIAPHYAMSWPWPIVNQALFALAGLAWLVAASEHARGATVATGLGASTANPGKLATPQAAARWGRWATAVAVAIPLWYAVTRFAWALGIPLGITRRLLNELGELRYAGAMLGTLAVAGAALTLGLVQRWGEVFPRWIPGLRGRRVPVGLAVVPGYLVSAVLASAGLMFVRLALTGALSTTFADLADEVEVWLWVPEMLWLGWGAALATATHLYLVRRTTTPSTP
jgi:hypothetical protein